MPPNTPTKEEHDDGRARVGFTGEENMVLPEASGDEHGRREGEGELMLVAPIALAAKNGVKLP